MKSVWTAFSAFLVMTACTRETSVTEDKFLPLSRSASNRLMAVTGLISGGEKGEVLVLNLTEGRIHHVSQPVSKDAFLRAPLGDPNFYVINRWGHENIQIFSRETLTPSMKQRSYAAEGITVEHEGKAITLTPNLQDLAVTPRGTFLSAMGARHLFRVNLDLGSVDERISLQEYADGDGLPEATYLHWDGKRTWLQLQRLDGGKMHEKQQWEVTDYSSVLVLDDEIRKINLTYKNPVTDFISGSGGELFVATAGEWVETEDGAIESLQLDTLESVVTPVTEKLIKGSILDFRVSETAFWVVALQPSGERVLVKVGRDGKGLKILPRGDGENPKSLQGLELDRERGLLYVGVNCHGQPKIRLYDMDTLAIRAEIPVSLPVAQLVLVE